VNRATQAAYGTLPIIQLALASGVLLFALIVFVVLRPSGAETDLSIFRWVWLAFALLSIFGAGVVRGRLSRDATEQQAYTTAIIVWALAEGQALLGLVTYLVAGDRLPAVLGLVVGFYLFARHRASEFKPWFDSPTESHGS
jgi:F0F1-type ATP synthase membrane subunit c/vacuolar-type H+-ATPase subunit K